MSLRKGGAVQKAGVGFVGAEVEWAGDGAGWGGNLIRLPYYHFCSSTRACAIKSDGKGRGPGSGGLIRSDRASGEGAAVKAGILDSLDDSRNAFGHMGKHKPSRIRTPGQVEKWGVGGVGKRGRGRGRVLMGRGAAL